MPTKLRSRGNPFHLERLEPRTLLTVGALDPSFGNDGIAGFLHLHDASHLRLEPDGKFLATTPEGLVRFDANGAVDTAFGNDGIANAGFAPVDVAVVADDKLIVAGTLSNRFAVARFNTDGTLDTTFGTGGVATARHLRKHQLTAGDLVIQPNGQIIVGGAEVNPYMPFPQFDLAQYTSAIFMRFNADGSLDSSYGNSGAVNAAVAYSTPIYMGLFPDGSIIATIHLLQEGQEPYSQIVQIDSTGQQVTTVEPVSNVLDISLTMDPLGRAFVVEAVGGTTRIRLYADTGLLKNYGFVGGLVGLAVQSDGSQFIADYEDRSISPLTLRHYLADGSQDTTFGGNGVVGPALPRSTANIRFSGDLVTLPGGDTIIPGYDERGHLVLMAIQTIDQPSTNPVVNSVTFTPPAPSARWGYATVTFSPGSANLDSGTLATNGLTVQLFGEGNTFLPETTVTGTLISSSGGNGQPLTATYAFRSRNGELSRLTSTYQFDVAAGTVTDANGRGNVGAIGGTFTLRYTHSRSRRLVASPAPVMSQPFE